MLGRDNNLGGFNRLAAFVTDGHLALGVRPECLGFAGAARLRHHLENVVCIIDWCRHEVRGFPARIAEHDALVARALVFVAGGIDALRDIARLCVQMHFDRRLFPMKALLFIPDVLHGEAGDVGDVITGYLRGTAGLARNHHPVGGRQRFTCDSDVTRVPAVARSDIEERIDNLIRDAVANLVGMALGNRFAGEQIACTRQDAPPLLGPGDEPRGQVPGGVLAAALRPVKSLRKRLPPFREPVDIFQRRGRIYRPSVSSPAICWTRSTMRRRSLASGMRMKALVSDKPSEVARKSDT